MKKIFKQSIDLFGKEKVSKEVRVETTVQEKNITFPTDRKLTEKVIEHCKWISKKEGITLKRTYTFEIRKLKQQFRFARKPKNLKRESNYLKKKREERCRSRAGIEGLISHLKHDHRMIRNYLSGTSGDHINTLLAATANNMKNWIRLKKEEIMNLIFWLFPQTYILVLKKIKSTLMKTVN